MAQYTMNMVIDHWQSLNVFLAPGTISFQAVHR
jgi:hypothetical protein